MELTHASFFSGVGGLDLGLERAGWRTVSFSEIDPYANAVLAERWPGVPNLGDIIGLAGRSRGRPHTDSRPGGEQDDRQHGDADPEGIPAATLWSGGFPCQDLSVAGKRAGFGNALGTTGDASDVRGWSGGGDSGRVSQPTGTGDAGSAKQYGTRSGLAFAFLDLVERHRPPAILLENVPGLLSSHGGRDLGALLGRLGELGYWWAYRVLDARHFGVPQRRRRVFIVGLHAGTGLGADSAAEVLSVGTRCGRHPATGHATGEGTAASIVGSLDTALGHHGGGWPAQSVASGHVVADGQHVPAAVSIDTDRASRSGDINSPAPDSGGVRAPDGLAGRLDDLAPTLRVGPAKPQDGGPGDTVPIVTFDPTASRDYSYSDSLAPPLKIGSGVDIGWAPGVAGVGPAGLDDPLLPLGLDSHRYRCCGNGVVASVSEYIGWRLRSVIEEAAVAA